MITKTCLNFSPQFLSLTSCSLMFESLKLSLVLKLRVWAEQKMVLIFVVNIFKT